MKKTEAGQLSRVRHKTNTRVDLETGREKQQVRFAKHGRRILSSGFPAFLAEPTRRGVSISGTQVQPVHFRCRSKAKSIHGAEQR